MRSVRVRLLPWRPRLRELTHTGPGTVFESVGQATWDLDVAILLSLAFVVAVVLLCLLLFSVELVGALLLVPLLMVGQLLGRLPWQLSLRDVDGRKHFVSVSGTRKMLEARRHYRSLRVA